MWCIQNLREQNILYPITKCQEAKPQLTYQPFDCEIHNTNSNAEQLIVCKLNILKCFTYTSKIEATKIFEKTIEYIDMDQNIKKKITICSKEN